MFRKKRNGRESPMEAILGGGGLSLSKDEIAEMLKTSPDALEVFERSYRNDVLSAPASTDNFFELNAKQASEMRDRANIGDAAKRLNDRIIEELLAQAPICYYDGEKIVVEFPEKALGAAPAVTVEEVYAIPEEIQPQLTGSCAKSDIPSEAASSTLLSLYKGWLDGKDPKERRQFYGLFRQGLDILDLDAITYRILGTNPNAMGYWLPALICGIEKQEFFKVPKTKIIKVPITLLQLTRTEYGALNPSTMDIVDRFCQRVFALDETKDYFIKTGTFSSKFDFRNAKVSGAKEVRELGEYLLFIQFQAQQMASPLASPCIYGASTTNEWVVREFIPDPEDNPCIYKGLPLRTEYRLFVDFDENAVLGMNPYWDPDVMKQRFGHESDAGSPHQIHDYLVYMAHEDRLMSRYNDNAETVKSHILSMLPDIPLSGQWSVDVMQSGDEFYIIDMALAQDSALSDCVPEGLLRHQDENWLPRLDTKPFGAD